MRIATAWHTSDRSRCARRGTVMVLAILVAVILTAFVMLLAWCETLANGEARQRLATDQAFYVAESGAQRALWYWKHNNYAWTNSGSWTFTLGGTAWTQTYSCTPSTSASGSYLISCRSSSALGTSAFTCAFLATPPASSAPALFVGGNANISSTVTIRGDLQTRGAVQNANNLTITGDLTSGQTLTCAVKVSGNASIGGDINAAASVGKNLTGTANCNASPTVGGNLSVNGVIQGSPVVGGTRTAGAHNTVQVPATPNVAAMFTTVSGQATAAGTWNAPTRVTSLDLTTISNGILYINGDATISTNITIKGSGTIVVSGNWNQSASVSTASGQTVNLLVKGGISISGSLSLTGSMYTGSNWIQSGTFSITGVVVTTSDANISGNGTITAASPPSFDSRSSSAGSGAIAETNFTGPAQ